MNGDRNLERLLEELRQNREETQRLRRVVNYLEAAMSRLER